MLAVFQCVALAIKENGLRGLSELVPGGQYILNVAKQAYKLLRERQKEAAIKEEIAKVAAASIEEAKKVAEQVAKQVANEAPPEERIALELYLTQLPGAVRQSLKRADDPTGKTVPPEWAIEIPEDFAKMLPLKVPHFRPGGELPGRPGWRLDELLGAGGFGEVWLARHSFLPHPRAVKFCTDVKVRAKLTSHEGKVIARVMEQGTHPNVVPLLDAVLDGDTPWLMYEYVGGGSLTDLIIRWQPLHEGQREALVVQSLLQLASAVGTFHKLTPAIVHRDLKPANILLASGRQPSEAQSLRITDFGIGGVAVDYLRTHPGGLSLMTGWLETSMRGSYTPLYASPQQSRGAAPDPRDDVHALGVIGFQMLTGKLTESPSPRFERDLKRRGISEALIDLNGDCVDSAPCGRPKDAGELTERLSKVKVAVKPIEAKSVSSSLTGARLTPHPLRPQSRSERPPPQGGRLNLPPPPLRGRSLREAEAGGGESRRETHPPRSRPFRPHPSPPRRRSKAGQPRSPFCPTRHRWSRRSGSFRFAGCGSRAPRKSLIRRGR